MADTTTVPDFANLLRLDGRGFVVMGAGQGMGRQSAHALSQQGARVVCVDIEPDRAEAVAAEIGGIPYTGDVLVAEQAEAAIVLAEREFGDLRGVVDVVGMARYAPLVEMTEEDWDWCHDTVVRHAFHTVKYGGAALGRRGGGSIVLVASISGV